VPIETIEIHLIVDNVADPSLISEHGLSMWIETPNQRILFDTGQGPALAANADKLGIALDQATALVLSHGHYDHTGGVAHVLRCNPSINIFCHPCAVQPRYSFSLGAARSVQMPRTAMMALDKLPSSQMHWISEPVQLSKDIGLTGPIPREATVEDTGGPFFLDPDARRIDAIKDDAALWISTPQGLVVCVGCCHAGLINTLKHAQRLSGVSALRAVIGGFHLLHAKPERLEWTLSQLKALAPAAIVGCHCTGEGAMDALEETFNSLFSRGYAGMRIPFR
jgi:7,8-dihydropterin-6-yl-methyl-4-(beta-D-ribofuranosyl)aminobenzene 5'-phosphate synthase